MNNPVYDEILNVAFSFQDDLMAAQKLWVNNMCSKVPGSANPKMGKLNEQTTLVEWSKFFLKSKEGTYSSISSGLHRGIYKVCTTNDVLAMMKMTIVTLAFEFRLKGILRWHK